MTGSGRRIFEVLCILLLGDAGLSVSTAPFTKAGADFFIDLSSKVQTSIPAELLTKPRMSLRGGGSLLSGNRNSRFSVKDGFENGAKLVFDKLQCLQASIETKRLELCPWEQFGIECEEAFAYQQTWICPSQGWNRLQRAVDAVACRSQGSAFVPNKAYWPVTLMVLAKSAMSRYWQKAPKAPPFGSNEPEIWIHTRAPASSPSQDLQKDVKWVNSNLVKAALGLLDSTGWEEVSREDQILVWRKYLSPDTVVAGKRLDSAAKFACVKAHAIIDAPIEEVYSLFVDNKRVHEYNEYCKEVKDLEWLDESTKVTYSMTGRPWSRDFVTRVHYSTLPDSTRVIVNRAEEHPLAPQRPNFTRMTMPLGANILRTMPGDPSKTEVTLITHVNPGGFAQTHFGAMVTNRLSTDSPRQFLSKLNSVAHRSTVPKRSEAKQHRKQQQQQPRTPWRLGLTAAVAAFSVLGRDGGAKPDGNPVPV